MRASIIHRPPMPLHPQSPALGMNSPLREISLQISMGSKNKKTLTDFASMVHIRLVGSVARAPAIGRAHSVDASRP